jgi:hypothetical protein
MGQQVRQPRPPFVRHGCLDRRQITWRGCSELIPGGIQPPLDYRIRLSAAEKLRKLIPDALPAACEHCLHKRIRCRRHQIYDHCDPCLMIPLRRLLWTCRQVLRGLLLAVLIGVILAR